MDNKRKIAAELAAAGHLTDAKYRGNSVERPFNSGTIKAMIEGPVPGQVPSMMHPADVASGVQSMTQTHKSRLSEAFTYGWMRVDRRGNVLKASDHLQCQRETCREL
jgi:hypothetical protein